MYLNQLSSYYTPVARTSPQNFNRVRNRQVRVAVDPTCTKVCGGGMHYRRVFCSTGNGAEVADTYCRDIIPKPVSEEACNVNACGGWISTCKACSVTCGDGTQECDVTCPPGQTCDPDDPNKPTSSQVCHNSPCGTPTAGEWSACDSPCGPGQQTRTSTCAGGDGCDLSHIELTQSCDSGDCKWGFGDWLQSA